MDKKKIRKKLEKSLDPKRFEHTLGVSYTAAALAMRYEEDMEKALLAGLLHDCAKCLSNEKKIAICKKHHIPITDAEKANPFLLHAKAGAYLAKKEFHVKDEEILHAILYHNTGRPGMSPLEKIVYVADYIEPSRDQAPELSAIRKCAFTDLDQALLMILKDTLQYLNSIRAEIDPITKETYEYYLKEEQERKC